MTASKGEPDLAERVRAFVRRDFSPHFGQLAKTFPADSLWQRLRELGSELWLDTGSLAEAGEIWTREFSALTTNNTLLNKEVQTGAYDSLILEAAEMLAEFKDLTERQRRLEIAFILNARHGLRLVERFDAHVSVEEHTDLAFDVAGAVDHGRRYHAVCPERFIVKVPFAPAGMLASRRLSEEGVSVNHTLGFSARQNYLMARIGRPRFVNVFLGRLNSFIADNALGDGAYVGERATVASQAAIRRLGQSRKAPTWQIGASFRSGQQIRDLAGIDVMTVPPAAARQFLDMGIPTGHLADRSRRQYQPVLAEGVDPAAIRLETLWEIGQDLTACVDGLEEANLEAFTPADLVRFFADHGCGDVLVNWTAEQVATSAAEGKIPRLANWREALAGKAIGLDSLMNLAGLTAFASDQKAMDARVAEVLARRPKAR